MEYETINMNWSLLLQKFFLPKKVTLMGSSFPGTQERIYGISWNFFSEDCKSPLPRNTVNQA